MSKQNDILSKFGSNLSESVGATRNRSGQGGAHVPNPPKGPNRHEGVSRLRTAVTIEINRIQPDPNQPRVEFDAESLTQLAKSLKSHGQLQPISVRWSRDDGRYIIVTGERRWRAAQQAGFSTIQAIMIDGDRTIDPERAAEQVLELQLIENCIRDDLKPVEQAKAFRTLMDRNGWTATRLAEALHLTGASVSRALALLELPDPIQESVDAGRLAPSVAYEVSKLGDSEAQTQTAQQIMSQDLSREEAVQMVRQSRPPSKQRSGPSKKAKSASASARTESSHSEPSRSTTDSGQSQPYEFQVAGGRLVVSSPTAKAGGFPAGAD